MALFITFEGGEGCGKSVQSKALYRRLLKKGIPAILTREPGGTSLGESIARWLKWHKEADISAIGELLLFNASRHQLVDKVIKPALSQNEMVVCDRFFDSTVVYQGYGRGLGLVIVKQINNLATGDLKPDLTILLDMPVREGLARKKNGRQDRFEGEKPAFHEKVRRGYLDLARREPERWFIIDARQSKQKIADIIWNRISHLLAERDT